MRSITNFLIALALLLTAGYGVQAASLLESMKDLPECGVNCFVAGLSLIECDFQKDPTCTCNEATFRDKVEKCIVTDCNSRDALTFSKFDAKTCNRPYRSKQGRMLLPVIVQAPSWLCPWLRLYSRWVTLGKWDIDDYIMLAVGIIYTPFLVLGQYTGQQALGLDMWTLEWEEITQALKQFYACESLYIMALALSKISVLFFYLRIFPQKSVRIAVYVSMGLVAIPAVVFVFVQIFQCYPLHYIWTGWHLQYYSKYCVNVHQMTYAAAGFSIFQDVLIIVVPLPTLFKLKLNRKQKIGIIIMFSLGIFITVTSGLRLKYIMQFGHSVNPTWDYGNVIIWTGLEVAVAIIVACLPSIGVLLKHWMPWMRSSVGSSYTKDASGSEMWRGRSSRNLSDRHQRAFRPENHDDGDSQIELGFDLGDKSQGESHTRIARAHNHRSIDERDDTSSDEAGIRVRTETVISTLPIAR